MDHLRQDKTAAYRERLITGIRADMEIKLDSANVAWTAARFPAKLTGQGTSHLTLDTTVPSFDMEDTSRVIATYRGGKVTLGRLNDGYRAIPELLRPSLDSVLGIQQMVDVLVLEPKLADIARRRGYDRDSVVVAEIELRREQLMVERLYGDSIEAKTFVPPADRRKYYQQNQHRFVTSPNAVYAMFYVPDKKTADAVAGRLRKGVKAEAIIREDSLKGVTRGRIDHRRRDDEDNPFFRQVFFDMKPGDISFLGPDPKDSTYNVIQLIDRDSGRQVPFEEADSQIDEYLRQEASEKLLAAFIERHKKGMRVESHPELVMRIRLVDPN
jgi:hypothetical protein